MKFHKKLEFKASRRTKWKLVFRAKTGELQVIKDKKINHGDIEVDAMFYDGGNF